MAASNRTSTLQVKFVVDGDGRVVAAFGSSADSADKAAKALDRVATEADRADRRMAKTAETFKHVGTILGTVVSVAALAVVGGLTAATKAAIDNADALRDLSIRTGVGVETLSAYSYAAKQTGTDVEALGVGLKVLARNVAAAVNPTSAQAKIFEALGIEVLDTTGKLRGLDALLPEIADKYRELEDGTTKAALAQALFGRSGLDLTEFLNQGSQGLDDFTARAKALGIVIDGETAAAADDFNDTLGDLHAAIGGLGVGIARELLPTLKETTSDLVELVKRGDAASDIAAVIGAAFRGATTILEAYEKAVRLTTLAMENAVVVGRSIAEIQKNILTFGYADGSVAEGLARIAQQKAASDRERAEILAGRPSGGGSAPAAQAPAAPPANQALGRRLAVALSNPSAASASSTDQAARAAENFRLVLERLQGELDGPLGRAQAEHARRLVEIERLAKAGKVSHEDLAEAVRLEGERYAKTTDEIKRRYEEEIGSLSGPVAQEEAEHARRLHDIEEIAREYAGTGDRVNAMLAEEARQHALAAREARRQADPAAALLEDMQFEIRLMQLSNADRETAIALRRLEGQVTDDQAEAIASLNRTMEEERKNVQFMDDFRGNLVDLGITAVNSFGQIDDSFKSMMNSIAEQIERRILEGWIDQLFGPRGSTGSGTSGGNLLGGLLGGLFGNRSSNAGLTEEQMYAKSVSPGGLTGNGGSGWASTVMGWIGALFGGNRAAGGDTLARHFYRVNEQQPELLDYEGQTLLMMGSRGGRVRPMQPAMAGGNTYNITVGVEGHVDRRTRSQIAAETAQQLRRAQGRNG